MKFALALLTVFLPAFLSAETVLISFHPGASEPEIQAALRGLGLTEKERIPELGVVAAEAHGPWLVSALAERAAHLPQVSAFSEDFYWPNWLVGRSLLNTAFPTASDVLRELGRFEKSVAPIGPALPSGVNIAELPWGIQRVNAPAAWKKTAGAGVRVAVIDTGIDAKHPDLAGSVAGGYAATGNSWHDDNGHGTHVAGTIAGRLDGQGVAGVAPSASLYAVKVLDKNGGGSLFAIIKGLTWCARNGIQVANMSLGAPMGTVFMHLAVKYAVSNGVVVVAAAGNSAGSVDYPGAYPESITVAASDSNDRIASFSSRGKEVDFIAPGVDVKSSVPGGGYDYYDGTSMATPHVAGLAALAVAGGARGSAATHSALRAAARSINLPKEEQGAGMIDAGLLVR
jgi:subtilisin family serine protease